MPGDALPGGQDEHKDVVVGRWEVSLKSVTSSQAACCGSGNDERQAAVTRDGSGGSVVTGSSSTSCEIHTAFSSARPIRQDVTTLSKALRAASIPTPLELVFLQHWSIRASKGPRVLTHTGSLSFTPHQVSIMHTPILRISTDRIITEASG